MGPEPSVGLRVPSPMACAALSPISHSAGRSSTRPPDTSGSAVRPASLRRTSADSFGGAAGAPRARSSSSSSSSSSGFLFSSFSFGGGSSSAAHVAEMSAPTATARISSGKPFA